MPALSTLLLVPALQMLLQLLDAAALQRNDLAAGGSLTRKKMLNAHCVGHEHGRNSKSAHAAAGHSAKLHC